MKFISLYLLTLFSITMSYAQSPLTAITDSIDATPPFIHPITPKIREVLESHTVFEAFQVEAFQSDTGNLLKGFKIIATAKCDSKIADAIYKILNDTLTYLPYEVKKMCLFLPSNGYVFKSKEKRFTVLLSKRCNMLRFYLDDGSETFNCDGNIQQFLVLDENIKYKKIVEGSVKEGGSSEKAMMKVGVKYKPKYYTAKNGESWTSIAKKLSKTNKTEVKAETLWKWNNIDPELGKVNKGAGMLKVNSRIIIGFEE
jgi:hypothetical protein